MNKQLATVISYIFHPVVFALLTPFIFVYRTTDNFWYGMKWAAFSAGFLFIIFFCFYLLHRKRIISDIDISNKKERHIFYSMALLTAVIYFIASLIFKGILFPLSIVSLGMILGIVLFDIVTYYRKISIHVAVATAYVVSIGILYGLIPFFATIWIVFVVAIARITLKQHTPKEAIAGMLLGTFIPLATFFIGKLVSL